jgi:hypothetical protein
MIDLEKRQRNKTTREAERKKKIDRERKSRKELAVDRVKNVGTYME